MYPDLLKDIEICQRLLEKTKKTAKPNYTSVGVNTLAVRRTRKMVNEILKSYETYR